MKNKLIDRSTRRLLLLVNSPPPRDTGDQIAKDKMEDEEVRLVTDLVQCTKSAKYRRH